MCSGTYKAASGSTTRRVTESEGHCLTSPGILTSCDRSAEFGIALAYSLTWVVRSLGTAIGAPVDRRRQCSNEKEPS
jgi:hypothetical protein